jgi:Leucine-rich repeat (LRR) protein
MATNKVWVQIFEVDDPAARLLYHVGTTDESLILKVTVSHFGGKKIDQIVEVFNRLVKPQWTLHFNMSDSIMVPESVWELANLEDLALESNRLKTISPAIAKLTKLKREKQSEEHPLQKPVPHLLTHFSKRGRFEK